MLQGKIRDLEYCKFERFKQGKNGEKNVCILLHPFPRTEEWMNNLIRQ